MVVELVVMMMMMIFAIMIIQPCCLLARLTNATLRQHQQPHARLPHSEQPVRCLTSSKHAQVGLGWWGGRGREGVWVCVSVWVCACVVSSCTHTRTCTRTNHTSTHAHDTHTCMSATVKQEPCTGFTLPAASYTTYLRAA